jgi:hypothetical protein
MFNLDILRRRIKMTNATTVTRSTGFSRAPAGGRIVKSDKVTKIHKPLMEGMIIAIKVPAIVNFKQVPANDKRPALPYTDWEQRVDGGHILINSFLEADAVGKTVICEVKVGLKGRRRNSDGATESFFYMKLNTVETDTVPTHSLEFVCNALSLADAPESAAVSNGRTNLKGDAQKGVNVFDCSSLNDEMGGGIIVTALN